MEDSKVPKGFPQPSPTTSYWQLPPHAIANHRTTPSLPILTVDYVIVGSGISAAAVAHQLLSRAPAPAPSVLMLEARAAASGASGRNGGHCRAGWWLHFRRYAGALGEDEALALARLEERTVADVAAFVGAHGVECELREVETADAYASEEAWAEALEVVRAREEVRKRRGRDAEPLGERTVWRGREARERLGLPGVLGAVTYPAYTLNPYLLVCRMLELCLEKGLNLQTNTPVLAVTPVSAGYESDAKWEVQTDRGTVRARQVVLATNAYTNALHDGLAKTAFLVPSRSQVTAIRPKRDLSGHPSFRKSVALNDRGSGDYFAVRAPGLKGEGDVLFGGGRAVSKTREAGVTDDSKVNEKIAAYLKRAAPEVFGRESWGEQSEEIRDWSGITCYTPDTLPLVGEVPGEDGLWMLVGMNGHGMALAFRCAEALVTMMTTGKHLEWFPKSLGVGRAWKTEKVYLRPEPFVE